VVKLSQVIRSCFNRNPAPPDATNQLTPPRELIDGVGGGDFAAIGKSFFDHFTKIGGLQPNHRVLDVGCGCGRMAVPMIPFLKDTGEYWGFDIVPAAIEWSRSHITAHHPRFHFDVADIYNKLYNPGGKTLSLEYRFPHADNFFDFTLLTSVFTHMLAADMEHYLAEISRTLKPGGRCMISFFLLNAEARGLMAAGNANPTFDHPQPGCTISNPEYPEAAVAYDEPRVRKLLAQHGLRLIEPVHFGSWCGRATHLNYQDIILATKR
jgi:SAM-dependent methyltransferase